jgi:hypothetical protein
MTSAAQRSPRSVVVATLVFTAMLGWWSPLLAHSQDRPPQDASAQQPPARSAAGGPIYDVSQETTIRGTVVEVKKTGARRAAWLMHGPVFAFRRGRGAAQQPLFVVRTDTDTLTFVHAGPTSFLEEHRIEIHKGDEIGVTGVPISLHGNSVILAREITRADCTWTIRDATGGPLWQGKDLEPRRSRKAAVLAFATKAPLILLLVRVLA